MAPMTRDRSTPEGVPTELTAEYYAQRASNALIITKGTQPSLDGQGYLQTASASPWRSRLRGYARMRRLPPLTQRLSMEVAL